MKKFLSVLLSVVFIIIAAVPSFALDGEFQPGTSVTGGEDPGAVIFHSNAPAPASFDTRTVPLDEDSGVIIIDAPECEGYEFLGWNTSPDGNGVTFQPDELLYVSYDPRDFNLYGMWAPCKDTPVATLYLCVSGPRLPYVFGHAWICIRNTGVRPLTVGSRTIEPGEMASFGLHHFDGMHCDDEMSEFAGSTVTALEYPLTQDALNAAGSEITGSRWHSYEYFSHNCTNFATAVWNRVTGQHLFALCFPAIVQIQMAANHPGSLLMSSGIDA